MAGWESVLLSVGRGRAWFVVGAVLPIRRAETLRAERPGCGLCFLLERSGCAVWLLFAPVCLDFQLSWRCQLLTSLGSCLGNRSGGRTR